MIVGLDPGERRIGVAVADLETRFARPVEVIDAAARDPVARVAELVAELDVQLVVVGRPVSLSGTPGPGARRQAELVEALRAVLPVEVVEHDERLTTVLAERGMRAAGARGKAVKARADAVAAQVMLQGYLDGGAP